MRCPKNIPKIRTSKNIFLSHDYMIMTIFMSVACLLQKNKDHKSTSLKKAETEKRII